MFYFLDATADDNSYIILEADDQKELTSIMNSNFGKNGTYGNFGTVVATGQSFDFQDMLDDLNDALGSNITSYPGKKLSINFNNSGKDVYFIIKNSVNLNQTQSPSFNFNPFTFSLPDDEEEEKSEVKAIQNKQGVTCINCNDHNPYADYVENYVCKYCQNFRSGTKI
jgi:hypothetical protein